MADADDRESGKVGQGERGSGAGGLPALPFKDAGRDAREAGIPQRTGGGQADGVRAGERGVAAGGERGAADSGDTAAGAGREARGTADMAARDGKESAGRGGEVARAAGGEVTEIKKIGRKNFAAVYIAATEEQKRLAAKEGATDAQKAAGVGRVVKLSDQEAVVLRTFLDTRDYQAAQAEAGKKPDGSYRLSVQSVKRMLRRPNVRAVIEAAVLKATSREGVDLDWVYSENRLVYEGDKKKDAGQMAAMKNIVELVKPRGTGMVIQQNNINSVYAGKTRETVEAEWSEAQRDAGGGE